MGRTSEIIVLARSAEEVMEPLTRPGWNTEWVKPIERRRHPRSTSPQRSRHQAAG
ncbi:hypothetical protein ACWD8L_15265 [Streptomyces sp. NPDC005133]